MKRLLIIAIVLILSSCTPKGVAIQRTNGNEKTLPDELKGLKVYDVSIGEGDYIKVALMNGKSNSTRYMVGKIHETTIIINSGEKRLINAKEIISETDSILVIKK